MIRAWSSFLFVSLSTAAVLTEVASYAKVSRNGQEETKSGTSSWSDRVFSPRNETQDENEGRSFKDIVITVSPVYVAPKVTKLQNGQAVEYPSSGRYSTLDREMIAQLDTAAGKKQIQERYHPSPIMTSNNGQSSMKQQNVKMRPISPPSSDSFEYSKPFSDDFDSKPSFAEDFDSKPSFSEGFDSKPSFSDDFDSKPPFSEGFDSKPYSDSYHSKPSFPDGFDYKPPDYLSDKPISKPMTMEDYPDSDMNEKPPKSYKQKPEIYYSSHDHDSDFSDFPPDSFHDHEKPPKQIDFSGHLDHPPYDDPYEHEIIYDHIPDYHDHPHDHTEQPEMNDQRLDKRPYSYYFIGKKLWYIPLYFSIYFIIYIAALVLKSIARHKISFPAHLAEAVGHSRKADDSSWWDFTGRVLEGIENFAEKFGKVS